MVEGDQLDVNFAAADAGAFQASPELLDALRGALGDFFFLVVCLFFVSRACPSHKRVCKVEKTSSYVLIDTSMLVVKVSSEAFLTKYNQLEIQFKHVLFCVCEILLKYSLK